MNRDDLLHDLAARFGTPLYLYDLDRIEERVQALRAAVSQARIRYAVKANPSGAILERLASLGVGAEAITSGELARSLRAGMPAASVLLGGPGQDAHLRQQARDAGVGHVSLDNTSQWRAWRQRPPADTGFLIRVRPDFDPRTHPHLATGAMGSKFGLSVSEASMLADEVHDDGRLAGFHVHAGSMIEDPEVHREILRRIEPLFARFPTATTLDLGGGFAVPDFDLDRFAALLEPWLGARGLSLIVEPGRWLVADAGVLLTRVLWRKPGDPVHWICDAGMAQLLRPALYDAEHPIRVVEARSRVSGASEGPERGEVGGPLCENADRLGRDRLLAAREGDLLAVERTGAYGMAMASHYASELHPAEVVLEAGLARLVRRRETTDDLWRLEAESEPGR